jgi:HlyD family secretion protein
VVSAREAFLYFPLAGTINAINVAAGDQVKQGLVLAKLDPYNLNQAVDAAQFNLDQANVQLRQAQAKLSAFDFQIEVATNVYSRTLDVRNKAGADYQAIAWIGLNDPKVQAAYDRFQRLDADYLRAATDLNNVKTNRQVAVLDVEAQQRAVQNAQRAVDLARARLASTELTAPLSGLIVSVDKRVGDQVQAFEAVGAIADPTELQIEATVPESDVISVGLGQPASVVLDGFPNQRYSGKVKEISAKATIFQGKSSYRIIVSFDSSSKVPATLRLGADVMLTTQVRNNALIIPTQAVVVEGTKNYVTVIRNGKPQRVEVQVGIANETQTEILAGLLEGEQIQVP